MSRIDEAIQAKKEKRATLEALGLQAHPYSFNKQHTIAQARTSEGQVVRTAGRIVAERTHGKVVFYDLQDSTDRIQILIRLDEQTPATQEWLALVDRGDFLGVEGTVTTTRTGELTIEAQELTFLGKALRPIPTQWNAAEDKENRFRQRYLDMLISPETRRVLDARWLIEKEVRRYLQDQYNFTEVETPVFQPLYGGTNAKPFTTHMNALDVDFYLRLAPELYLKRLVVGGYERIFEIARNFRNEGIDQTHQPEFTMIEWYEAYADYHRMMDVAEGLIKHLVKKLHGESQVRVGEQVIELDFAWPRLTMLDSLKQFANLDFESLSDEQVQALLAEHQIQLKSDYTRGKALFELFDHLVTPSLIEPIWIIDYPRDISPLAKAHRLDPRFAERYELYIGTKELADGWSEITDALDQRSIWENEQRNLRAGDVEAHPLDEDFLEAMEYGMPPLGGIGMGIDRLVMFLTNTWSIKEVIAFPTLRPTAAQQRQKPPATTPQPMNVSQEDTEPLRARESGDLPPRAESEALLEQYVETENLRRHCRMVAQAMEAYARELGEDTELWYQAGLLHDLDWEKYPDEHPNKAVNEILAEYPEELKNAILAHGPELTGRQPAALIERYLYACDELSGFMYAVSLMRPDGFAGMAPKSVKKKLKDKAFASNVSREDIQRGFELIGKEPDEHIGFLISVFSEKRT